MSGYYAPFKIFTPGEILTAVDLNSSEQQHVTYNTALAVQGYSQTLEQSRVQVGSATLATTVADEISRLREKIRLLGGKTYWDEVTGPTQLPVMPRAQILLPLEGAVLPDGTTGNAFPTAVERISTGSIPPGNVQPKIVEVVYDFSATIAQYLMWKITTPLGYKAGELIEIIAKFTMADNVTSGNLKIVAGIAPVRDDIDNVNSIVTTTTMTGPDNVPIPPVWGVQKEYRISIPTTNVVENEKCIVVLGVQPATTGNATGRRRLESVTLEFSRGNFILPDPGMQNPMTGLGDMIAGGASGSPTRLVIGSTDQILTVVAGVPAWKTPSSGFINPMNAFGDMIQGGTSGIASRLPIGPTGHVLSVVAGAPSWQPPNVGMVNPMTVEGDIITRSLGGPARVPIGLSGQVLAVVSGYPGWIPASPITLRGDLIVGNASGVATRLPIGIAGYVLTAQASGDVAWVHNINPMTAPGDIIVGGVAGVAERLPIGNENQVIAVSGGVVQWRTVPNPLAAPGDLIVGGFAGVQNRLLVGSENQILTVVSGLPEWQTSTAFVNPMTTQGDLIVGVLGGAPSRLPVGTDSHVLTTVGGVPTWQAPAIPPSVITTRGDLITGSPAGAAIRLPRGTSNQVLSVGGAGDLFWRAETGFVSPITTQGDLIVGNISGVGTRLPAGSETQVLTISAGVPAWVAPTTGSMANPMTSIGDVIIGSTAGAPVRLGIGAASQVLTVVGGIPTWQAPVSGGMTNPMTTPGDLIRGGASGAPTRFGIGTNGQFLTVTGGALTWGAAPGFTNPMTGVGDIIIGVASGVASRLGPGSDGQVLTLAGGTPSWAAPSGGMTNPMTAIGDLIRGGTSGAPTRVAIGTDTFVMTVVAGVPTWAAPSGFANPMTATGDLIRGGASGAATRFGIGTNGQVLGVTGGALAWVAQTGFANPMTTLGDVILGGASGAPSRLAIGTSNQVLTVVAGVVQWAAPAITNPMTTLGDLIVGASAGAPGRLGIGSTNQVLTVVDGTPTWAAPVGVTFPILAPDGSAAAPSYSFAGGPDMGLWRVGATLFIASQFATVFSQGGTILWSFNASELQPGIDTGQDLGDLTHRLRDLWLSRDIDFTNQGSAPATPASGHVVVYAKTDKKLYQKDDAGVETPLGSGPGNVIALPIEQASVSDATGGGSAELYRDLSQAAVTTNTPKRTRTFARFDAATDEHLMWGKVLPANYVSGGTLRVKWKSTTLTVGDVIWKAGAQISADGGGTDNSMVFNAADVSAAATVPATLGAIIETAIPLTMTGAGPNRECSLFLGRDADNPADTMAGDAVLISVRLEYA